MNIAITIAATLALSSGLNVIGADAGKNGVDLKETPKTLLQSKFYKQQTPYAGEITRGILTASSNQFSFVIPSGFRRLAEISGKSMTLTSTSLTASLTLRIFETATDGKFDLKPDMLRDVALSRYKGATMVEEFLAHVESMSGPAFEVQWSGAVNRMATRLAFVPYAGGHLEICVQSPVGEIRTYDSAFGSFLMMIRTGPIGTEVPVVEFLSEL